MDSKLEIPMHRFFLASLTLLTGIAYVGVFHAPDETPAFREQAASTIAPTTTDANRLLQGQPGFFVPNLGHWVHAARFVHRSGPMTLFLEDRGWVIDLVERPVEPKTSPHESGHCAIPSDGKADQKIRGVAVRMTFEGNAHVPEIIGEKKLPGHHNYFLGNDENRWRTGVPLYSSVRYEGLYPGIDLRLREAGGVPEYDLLLQPGADLSRVNVYVGGAKGLSIADDGSLVIATALGPLTQSVPKTWQVGADGRKREVTCKFTLLAVDRFGFEATGWNGDTYLTIDPGLIWSTYLGGSAFDSVRELAVDASGDVTVAGITLSTRFPTTIGAYDTTYNGVGSCGVFVSRLLPFPSGRAALLYSTFLGGSGCDELWALAVDTSGVVTVAGRTPSTDFPTTNGAYDTTHNGPFPGYDMYVSRLDPSQVGTAQLVYSTFLGGKHQEWTHGGLSVDSTGSVTLTGYTWSYDFPTTSGAYDTTQNGASDVFVSRLDPSQVGTAQLVYSTFLGGNSEATALSVDARGVVTVAGVTRNSMFPTTKGAYDTTYNGGFEDAFVSCLDLSKTGNAQLVYSTFLGGGGDVDAVVAVSVDANGVMTVTGVTFSTDFPTTRGAYDTTHNGPFLPLGTDAFVSRLDPSKAGTAQLVYSTFLGGVGRDATSALSVDASGVVTVAGGTSSTDFPTTNGAFDTNFNFPSDACVSRLDPSKAGTAQLVYSTFLGGTVSFDQAASLFVDASGVATVAGATWSTNFPTTRAAYNTTFNGGINDAFVSRLDMGVALYGNVHAIPINAGGTQKLTVNAGKTHANRLYWIFGSITGTKPGVNLLGVHIPLNPDLYTDVAMAAVNTKEFTNFRAKLDTNGTATSSFNVPANLPVASGFTFHHAYVVYDASGKFYMASNAVPLRLK
jgi:hypothetical protein